ncbi:hypothetical protein [Mucilaginibacter myungsuensis]|uniref:Uncharacterized protein n=1 Tax=Mucilaginibacter myungsuensis TaxID=649104 RepID=A0A929PW27_9SPHI|nr:hypothetical protein [Mucilaginibacter myungsuensis]MBE9660727.1 hypothetical protein [Mucilaginibacter myungsuensis]MDN3600772.1 hypothetical protein [Mucilaginibacter myungsuensis]
MKNLTSNIIGGIAGAIALNVLHQVVKQFVHEAPRVDLVGEEALSKGLEKVGIEPPTGNALFTATMAADLVSNAVYYATIGMGKKKKNLVYHGAAYGITAGIGALTLTEPMGLNDAPVNRTDATKVMTVAWYTIGGIVAGAVIKALRK